jgi:hypothetical protein
VTRCAVKGCRRAALKRGMCNAHYLRWWRHGDPLSGRALTGDPLKWLHKHTTHGGALCINWPFAAANKHGYGLVRFEGRSQIASRLMCRLAHGEPPPNRPWALHSCHNPACCNPQHLRWGTEAENAADRIVDGTHMVGEKHPGARLMPADVKRIRASAARTSDLSRDYGVSRSCIDAVRKHKSWTHL